MKKKVIILEDSSEMGGVQHSTLNFLKCVKNSEDFDFELIIPRRGTFSSLLDSEGIKYIIYNSIKLSSTSISIWKDKFRIPNIFSWILNYFKLVYSRNNLIKIILNNKASILITKGLGSHFLGASISRRTGIPCIMYLQDEISSRYFGFNIFIFNRFVLNSATSIITDGQTINSQLWDKYLFKTSLIYNGVSSKEMFVRENKYIIRKTLNIPSNAFVIGNVARITPWKGQIYLLKAFLKYAEENSNAYLVLVGSPLFTDNDYFVDLKTIAFKSHFSNRVIFTGYCSNLGSYLSAFDLFLYPSLEKDTTPLALISALLSGVSVAMSNIDSLKEIKNLISELNVFNPRDISEIISIMRNECFNDFTYRNKVIRELAVFHFSSEVMSNRILDKLKTL